MLPLKFKWTSQHLVTTLAGVFALVSVQNIAHFFIDLKHPTVASWTLGLAIGTALVVLAHLLSEINTRETKAFVGLLTVTLILVALSGMIQGNAYSHSLGNMGYLLAFVMAATGEIVLPLAHSWHRDSQRRQAVHDAGQRAESLAAQTLVDVMASVDVARAQAKAERRIEQLIVAHVDHIVHKLMPAASDTDSPPALPDETRNQDEKQVESTREASRPTIALSNDPSPSQEDEVGVKRKLASRPTTAMSDDPSQSQPQRRMSQRVRQDGGKDDDPLAQSFGPHNLSLANQARIEALSERQTQLLDLLRAEYDGKPVDALNRTDLGRQLNVSGKTIGRDLDALAASGALSMNGVLKLRHATESR